MPVAVRHPTVEEQLSCSGSILTLGNYTFFPSLQKYGFRNERSAVLSKTMYVNFHMCEIVIRVASLVERILGHQFKLQLISESDVCKYGKQECSAHEDLYIIYAVMGLKNGTNTTKIILRLFDDIHIVAKIVVFRKVNVVLEFVRYLPTYLPMRNSTANGNCPTKAHVCAAVQFCSNALLSRRLLR
uniref:Uncharacterized protein n=1 Tax=Glossina austeni TaxID=7395 RepID=A0A1A9UMA4_GLOAU